MDFAEYVYKHRHCIPPSDIVSTIHRHYAKGIPLTKTLKRYIDPETGSVLPIPGFCEYASSDPVCGQTIGLAEWDSSYRDQVNKTAPTARRSKNGAKRESTLDEAMQLSLEGHRARKAAQDAADAERAAEASREAEQASQTVKKPSRASRATASDNGAQGPREEAAEARPKRQVKSKRARHEVGESEPVTDTNEEGPSMDALWSMFNKAVEGK